uniref:Lipase domain-containing protein n=1 Tax=Timema douglasi TaxID=61478 RepID=A0A7R8Z912_TIMDO|nr:unnamed protein product [Timema douglasi]
MDSCNIPEIRNRIGLVVKAYDFLNTPKKPEGFSVISSLEPAQDRAKSSAKFMPSSSDEPLQKMAIASGEFTHMIPTTGNMMQMVDDTGRIQTVDLLEQPAPVVFNSANVKFLLYTSRFNITLLRWTIFTPTTPLPWHCGALHSLDGPQVHLLDVRNGCQSSHRLMVGVLVSPAVQSSCQSSPRWMVGVLVSPAVRSSCQSSPRWMVGVLVSPAVQSSCQSSRRLMVGGLVSPAVRSSCQSSRRWMVGSLVSPAVQSSCQSSRRLMVGGLVSPAVGSGGQNSIRLNPTNPIPIKTDKEYLPEMFNPSYETIFVIHGWKGSTQNVEDITKGYMRTRGNYNVIVVDWAIPSRDGYTTASYTSILVGGTVAKFIDYLASNGLRPSNVNIVGFSMGAHVAGTAGSRITSLDPAGPVFDLFPAGDKLTSDDADFVQVIHTNVGRFGYVGDLGHVDFYPNGGSVQNGCDQQTTLDSVLVYDIRPSVIAYLRQFATVYSNTVLVCLYTALSSSGSDMGNGILAGKVVSIVGILVCGNSASALRTFMDVKRGLVRINTRARVEFGLAASEAPRCRVRLKSGVFTLFGESFPGCSRCRAK